MININSNTTKEELTDIEITILKVMHSKLIYGKNHKQIETIMKSGFPKHLLGEAKGAIISLIKKDFI